MPLNGFWFGSIVECFLAAIITADFEPVPGAVRYRGEDDADQTSKHAIHSGDVRFECWGFVAMKANRERGIAGEMVEYIILHDRLFGSSVDAQEAAQCFA
jgi:hypothetical protein